MVEYKDDWKEDTGSILKRDEWRKVFGARRQQGESTWRTT